MKAIILDTFYNAYIFTNEPDYGSFSLCSDKSSAKVFNSIKDAKSAIKSIGSFHKNRFEIIKL